MKIFSLSIHQNIIKLHWVVFLSQTQTKKAFRAGASHLTCHQVS